MDSSSGAFSFIDAALRITGDKALSYVHGDLKWLIRDDLLSLLKDYPTLSPASDTFTHNDGSAVHLLHAHGFLPVSSSTPHVLLTIWLHQAYPFTPPLVYVFPTTEDILLLDHPFVRPSGVVRSPYLERWRYPKSNLVELVRDLVEDFRRCHPYSISSAAAPATFSAESSLPSKREAMDRLSARLHGDLKRFQAEVEAQVECIGSTQATLRDRARAIESALRELEGERRGLKMAVKESVNSSDVLRNWLLVHGVNSLSLSDDGAEGFEPADKVQSCLLENEAAAVAIDDVVYALDQALAAGALDFGTYIKQVRVLSREQFFHQAVVHKIQRSRKKAITGKNRISRSQKGQMTSP